MAGKKLKPADYLFWAVNQRTGSALRNHILIQLCNRAGKDGTCYPSHSVIAGDCECSVRAVKTHLVELEKAGFIAVTRRGIGGMKTSSVYSFPLANKDRQEVPNDRHIVHEVVQEVPNGGAGGALGVVQEVPIETPSIKHPIKHPMKHTPVVPTGFDRFFSVYPRKVGRAAAQKAWDKLDPQPALVNRIIDHIGQRLSLGDWNPAQEMKYIPHPATFIKQARWTDVIEPSEENKPRSFSFSDVQDLTESL